jgi:hypothetical protein
MSRAGMIMPELADLIEGIAERAQTGSSTVDDAEFLRRLARQVRGSDPVWSVRIHRKRGQKRKGGAGVDQRFAWARMVKAHRDEHGGTLEQAYRAISKARGVTVGPDSIEKAWKEMRPLLGMNEGARNIVLTFKRLKANGYPVTIVRKR